MIVIWISKGDECGMIRSEIIRKSAVYAAAFAGIMAMSLSFANMQASADVTERREGLGAVTRLYYESENGETLPEHWEQKGKDRYYLNSAGEPMKNTVVLAYDDQYYCLDRDGKMLKSQEFTYNGLVWTAGPDGIAAPVNNEEEEILREYCAELGQEITKSCSTEEEKVKAIFDYVWELKFDAANETNGSIQEAAMKTFDLGSGNCFGLTGAMHYLLQGVGIKDMIIHTTAGDNSDVDHWWNLVKIGEQYRHVDVTPFEDFHGFLLLTTDQLKAESESSPMVAYLHRYRESDYPIAK